MDIVVLQLSSTGGATLEKPYAAAYGFFSFLERGPKDVIKIYAWGKMEIGSLENPQLIHH